MLLSFAHASIAPTSQPHWPSRTSESPQHHDENDDSLEQAVHVFCSRDRGYSSLHNSLTTTKLLSTATAAAIQQRSGATRPFRDENVDFKQNADWWKDPLSHFEDVESTPSRSERQAAAAGESSDSSRFEETFRDPEFILDDLSEPIIFEPEAIERQVQKMAAPAVGGRGVLPPSSLNTPKAELLFSNEGQDTAPANSGIKGDKPKSLFHFSREFFGTAPFKSGTKKGGKPKSLFRFSKDVVPRKMEGHITVQKEPSKQQPLELSLLLATLIPPSVRDVLTRVPAIRVVALLFIGRKLIQWRPRRSHTRKRKELNTTKVYRVATKVRKNRQHPETELSMSENEEEDDEEEMDDEDVPEAFRNNPRMRAVFKKKKSHLSSDVSSVQQDNVSTSNTAAAASVSGSSNGMVPAMSGGWTEGIFGQRRPSTKQLMQQIASLEQTCQQAQLAKSNLEQAYELASWQLKESQTEFDKMKQTTKYLQAQLRDNEEMVERVVKREQLKAKDDILRMKEAMVKIVEREREAMREEFIAQAAELEQLLKQRRQRSPRAAPKTDNNNQNKFDISDQP